MRGAARRMRPGRVGRHGDGLSAFRISAGVFRSRDDAACAGSSSAGLTSEEAARLLSEHGPNEVAETRESVPQSHPRRQRRSSRRWSAQGTGRWLLGYIALTDPPRPDSAALRSLGVRTVMVSADAAAAAATVAQTNNLEGDVCPVGLIPDRVTPEDFAIYAGVFPEDKFRLVRAFQRAGHAVGVWGDGANDAPALRQAQMGIAVSTATDLAKAAAGIVLTAPGLGGIVTAIKEGAGSFNACSPIPRPSSSTNA